MKILILDDDEILFVNPPDSSPYINADVTQVNSVKAFFEVFNNDPNWDEIWVDNDLGTYATPGNSGIGLSKRFCFDYRNEPLTTVKAFRVTTMNPSAQMTIADNLRQTGVGVVISPISILESYGICRGDTFHPKIN